MLAAADRPDLIFEYYRFHEKEDIRACLV